MTRAAAALTPELHQQLKDEMRDIMIATARSRSTITYSELAMQLQTARVHYHSFLMARLLNEIGEEEIRAGRGVLPAVVVRKSNGIPGAGYFGISALQMDAPDSVPPPELEAMWRADLEAVYDYWSERDAGE